MTNLHSRIVRLLVLRATLKRYLKKMATHKDRGDPLLVFGALSDIQYADLDDGYNFWKTRKRYYRNALVFQKQALQQWKNTKPAVEFILQLGDIIDGFNRREGTSESSLEKTLGLFDEFKIKTYHVIGNHEIYNFKRAALAKTPLFVSGYPECQASVVTDGQFHYSFLPYPSLRIIVLDNYEIAAMGWPESSENHQEALKYLENNVNQDKNSPENLEGDNKRFMKYNGAVSQDQLKWLDRLLQESEEKKQNVVVVGHLPIFSEASSPQSLCWNYDQILEVFHRHQCVLTYWAGHHHIGGSAMDQHGIQHITFPGVLEMPPDLGPPIATVSLHPDVLHIEGQFQLDTYDLKLKFPLKSQKPDV